MSLVLPTVAFRVLSFNCHIRWSATVFCAKAGCGPGERGDYWAQIAGIVPGKTRRNYQVLYPQLGSALRQRD